MGEYVDGEKRPNLLRKVVLDTKCCYVERRLCQVSFMLSDSYAEVGYDEVGYAECPLC